MSESETPRTDVQRRLAGAFDQDGMVGMAAHAEQLERELAAAKAWKDAVIEKLAITWAITSENENCPQKAIDDLVASQVAIALDPAVSSDAAALIERGRQEMRAEVETLREVWKINSDAFAAKEAEVEVLRVAAQVVLDAMEAVRIANRSEGAGGGSWVSKPATREHQARVMKAYADMRKAEADLRAALAKEQP